MRHLYIAVAILIVLASVVHGQAVVPTQQPTDPSLPSTGQAPSGDPGGQTDDAVVPGGNTGQGNPMLTKPGGKPGEVKPATKKQSDLQKEWQREDTAKREAESRGDRKAAEYHRDNANAIVCQIARLEQGQAGLSQRMQYVEDNTIGGEKGAHNLWTWILNPAGVASHGDIKKEKDERVEADKAEAQTRFGADQAETMARWGNDKLLLVVVLVFVVILFVGIAGITIIGWLA